MIEFKKTDEVLRNANNVCYAINVTIDAYKQPLVYKTVSWPEELDSETTVDVQIPDWDNSNKVGTATKQILIPENKQTDALPAERRSPFTEFDTLMREWIQIIEADGDIIKIKEDFLKDNNEVYVSS